MLLLHASPALFSMLERLCRARGVVELVGHDAGGAAASSVAEHEVVARKAASHYCTDDGREKFIERS